jgi:6-phosphogluconolactonase
MSVLSTLHKLMFFLVQQSTLLLRQDFLASHTPTWLENRNNILYSTNEQNGSVASLAINTSNGSLSFINSTNSSGTYPTSITVAPGGDHILVANYGNGTVAAIEVDKNTGKFGNTTDVQKHNGSGPVKDRQEGPHAHQIIFDVAGKFVYSADLGADKVYQYQFNESTGKLSALETPFVVSDPGDGPRHLAFHPNNLYAYLACELSSAVMVFKLQPNGNLSRIQKLFTLPPESRANNYPAEILVHPSGNFVYVSNRGNDSISFFQINTADGTLTLMDIYSVRGAFPRGMILEPVTNIMFTMNQNSGTVTSHRVDPATGVLTYLGVSASGLSGPVCGCFFTTTEKI